MIEVEDLHFTYPGADHEAVRGISFAVRDGEIFGFLGPSGAGKSTTQKILIGILRAFNGGARVFGADLRDKTDTFYERIGVSFELPNLYTKLTARENLAFFRSLYSGETTNPEELLDMVGLTTDADTKVAAFSKGMKMRLNFCRAFLNQPELLFLDEPTSGLDPTNAARVKDIIRAARDRGCTVFLTTHDMVAAQELCDRVAFIVDGQLSVIDSPRALMIEHGRHRVRVEYKQNGATAQQEYELAGLGGNAEFLALIRDQELERIHSLEASLADIFIEVTGRELS